MRNRSILLVALLAVLTGGCGLAAGIFKGGMIIGVIIAVIIIGLLIKLFGGRGNP